MNIKNSWKIYILTAISFWIGVSQFAFGGFLDKIAVDFGVSIATAGQLTTVFSLAAGFGTPVVMMSASNFDRRKLQLIALTAIFISMVSTFLLPGFQFLLVSRALFGISFGVYTVCTFSIVTKLAAQGRQASALSNLAMGASAALVIGVPISRIIAGLYDWRIIFWVVSFMTLLGLLANIYMIPASISEPPISLGKQLAVLKKPNILIALSVTFFMFISFSVLNTYIAPYLIKMLPGAENKMSIILLIIGIASVIGAKIGGASADRFGARLTLLGGMIIQTITLLLLPVFSKSFVITILLLVFWSLSSWICGPVFNFNLMTIAPESSGILLSLNSTFIQVGIASGAALGGIIAGGTNIVNLSWVAALLVALAAIIAVVSYRLSNKAVVKI